MSKNTIKAVIIEPNRIPRPIEIEDDVLALSRKVNIDRFGKQCSEFEPFEIAEIKDNINIISSPKGKERKLPLVRTVGRYSKFYGIVYIVKMNGYELVSMSSDEAIDYCMKFMDITVPLERLGLPSVDYGDGTEASYAHDTNYTGRVDITFDDW